MTASRFTRLPIALLVGAMVLAGCGVKGPLEPPPGSVAPGATAPAGAGPNSATVQNVQTDIPGPSVTSTQTEVQSNTNVTRSPLLAAEKKKKRVKKGNVPLTSEVQVPDEPFIFDPLL